MPWSPVTGLPIQYSEDASGTAASGNYLKFYASGTTTPISMATDSTGGTTLAKCALNSLGQAINGSSAVFIPHIDQKYKAVLYPDSTTADANTFASAIWNVDGIEPPASNTLANKLVREFDTMAAAIAATDLSVDTVLLIKDRSNSIWDVVLSSGVTENTYNIVQCTGVGTLSLVLRLSSVINALEWGVSESASASVNAGAINASLAYASNLEVANEIYGFHWVLPDGEYDSDTINIFGTTADTYYRSSFEFKGKLNFSDDTAHGITCNARLIKSEVFVKKVFCETFTATTWANNTYGIVFYRALANCKIDIRDVEGGFTYGIAISPDGSGGAQFCKFYLDHIKGPKYHFYARSSHPSTSFPFSANAIYGGEFSNASYYTASDGSVAIYINGTAYANRLYAPNFEQINTAIKTTAGRGLLVDGPYFDTATVGMVAADLGDMNQVTWIHMYDNWSSLDVRFNAANEGMTFIGLNDTAMAFSEGFDVYIPAQIGEQDTASLMFAGINSCFQVTDQHSQTCRLNKGYETGSSAPTAGTYRAGAIAWNTSAATAGNPIGFIATVAGTQGTLNGGATTGTITIGTSDLVVNDATGLVYGQYIRVSDGGGGYVINGAQVLGISGTSVKLDSNATATATAQAVSFRNATFKSMPNHT